MYDIAVSLFRQKIKIKNIKKCYTFSFLVFKSALFGVYTTVVFFPSRRKAQNYFFGDDVVVGWLVRLLYNSNNSQSAEI
jgi:hypothetical protein